MVPSQCSTLGNLSDGVKMNKQKFEEFFGCIEYLMFTIDHL